MIYFSKRRAAKQILVLLSFFVCQSGFSQMEPYEFFTENFDASNVKTLSKFKFSEKFPDGVKICEIQFNELGQLVTIEDYQNPIGSDKPIVFLREMKYDDKGKLAVTYSQVIGLDKGVVADTLIYNDQDELVMKQTFLNGEAFHTINYPDSLTKKEFDSHGNLVKFVYENGDYTTYHYNADGKRTEELAFRDGEEVLKHLFQYHKDGRLNDMTTYFYLNEPTAKKTTYTFAYEGVH